MYVYLSDRVKSSELYEVVEQHVLSKQGDSLVELTQAGRGRPEIFEQLSVMVNDIRFHFISQRINHSDRLLSMSFTYQDKEVYIALDIILNHKHDQHRLFECEQYRKETAHNFLTFIQRDLYADHARPDAAAPQRPPFHIRQNQTGFLALTNAQAHLSTLEMQDNAPVMILGAAGTGKTLCAVQWLTAIRVEEQAGYFTMGSVLADTVRKNFLDQENICIFDVTALLDQLAVLFPEIISKPTLQSTNISTFKAWHEAQHKGHQGQKKKKTEFRASAISSDTLYAEFVHIIMQPANGLPLENLKAARPFLTEDQYMDLGQDQSYIEKENRAAIYAFFLKYIAAFSSENATHYEPSLFYHALWQQLIDLSEKQPLLLEGIFGAHLVIDEMQNLHPWLLHCLLTIQRAHCASRLLLIGDPSQVIVGQRRHVIMPTLAAVTLYHEHACKQYMLQDNFRSAPAIASASQLLFCTESHWWGASEKTEAFFNVRETNPITDGLLAITKATDNDFFDKVKISTSYMVVIPNMLWETLLCDAQKKQIFIDQYGINFLPVSHIGGLEYEQVIFSEFDMIYEKEFTELFFFAKKIDFQETERTTRNKDEDSKPSLAARDVFRMMALAMSRAQLAFYFNHQNETPALAFARALFNRIQKPITAAAHTENNPVKKISTPSDWLEVALKDVRTNNEATIIKAQEILWSSPQVWKTPEDAVFVKKILTEKSLSLADQIKVVQDIIQSPNYQIDFFQKTSKEKENFINKFFVKNPQEKTKKEVVEKDLKKMLSTQEVAVATSAAAIKSEVVKNTSISASSANHSEKILDDLKKWAELFEKEDVLELIKLRNTMESKDKKQILVTLFIIYSLTEDQVKLKILSSFICKEHSQLNLDQLLSGSLVDRIMIAVSLLCAESKAEYSRELIENYLRMKGVDQKKYSEYFVWVKAITLLKFSPNFEYHDQYIQNLMRNNAFSKKNIDKENALALFSFEDVVDFSASNKKIEKMLVQYCEKNKMLIAKLINVFDNKAFSEMFFKLPLKKTLFQEQVLLLIEDLSGVTATAKLAKIFAALVFILNSTSDDPAKMSWVPSLCTVIETAMMKKNALFFQMLFDQDEAKKTFLELVGLAEKNSALLAVITEVLIIQDKSRCTSFHRMIFFIPALLPRLIALAEKNPPLFSAIIKALTVQYQNHFIVFHLVARNAPSFLATLIALAESNTALLAAISGALIAKNKDQDTLLHSILRHAAEVLEDLLALAKKNPALLNAITRALTIQNRKQQTSLYMMVLWSRQTLITLITLAENNTALLGTITSALTMRVDNECIFFHMMVHAVPVALEKLIVLAEKNPDLLVEIMKALITQDKNLFSGFNLVAHSAPEALKKLVVLAEKNPDFLTIIMKALTIQDETQWTGFHTISQSAPETLEKLIVLAEKNQDLLALIMKALLIQDVTQWTGFNVIAQHAPKALEKLIALAEKKPELLTIIMKALTIQDEIQWTGFHTISQSAPKTLEKLIVLAEKNQDYLTLIMKALLIQNNNQWTGFHLIAQHAPKALEKLIALAEKKPELLTIIMKALTIRNVHQWSGFHTMFPVALEALFRLMALAEKNKALLEVIASTLPVVLALTKNSKSICLYEMARIVPEIFYELARLLKKSATVFNSVIFFNIMTAMFMRNNSVGIDDADQIEMLNILTDTPSHAAFILFWSMLRDQDIEKAIQCLFLPVRTGSESIDSMLNPKVFDFFVMRSPGLLGELFELFKKNIRVFKNVALPNPLLKSISTEGEACISRMFSLWLEPKRVQQLTPPLSCSAFFQQRFLSAGLINRDAFDESQYPIITVE